MAISFVGANVLSGASAAIPTYLAGDDIYVAAWRSGDWLSDPSGYTAVVGATANNYYATMWRKTAASDSSWDVVTVTGASYIGVWVVRGSSGVGASAVNVSSTTYPGLTLQQSGGASWVMSMGMGRTVQPATPAGMTSRSAVSLVRAADTNGGVTSWASGSTTSGHHFAVEILSPPIALTMADTIPTGETHYPVQWLHDGQIRLSPDTIPTGETHYAPTLKVATWRDWRDTPWWVGLVESRDRTVGSRVELIDSTGATVADLPVAAASVELHGTQPEQWAGSVVIRDPDWLPQDPTDLLDPRAGLRARIWWRLLTGVDSGPEVPLATLVLGDPQVRDREGAWEMTLTGRDVLSLPKRGGYRGLILDLGGMTVTAALKLLFAQLAPTVPVRVADTTLTLPSGYQVGLSDRTPAQDWTDLADVAGWVVRSDRDGVIVAGPRVDRTNPRADWSEGDDATVIELDRDVSTSDTVNRVIVRSTSTAGVWAVVEDDDPGSATWVGRYGPFERVIESDAVTTAEGALSMARMQYGRLRLPTESIQVRVPVRPDLDYRDPVILRRDRSGVGGTYLVSGWTIRLGPSPSLMEVAMMPRDML